MTLPIELAPEALVDVAEAFAHYDRVQPELANDFVARIDAALLLVAELPLARQTSPLAWSCSAYATRHRTGTVARKR